MLEIKIDTDKFCSYFKSNIILIDPLSTRKPLIVTRNETIDNRP